MRVMIIAAHPDDEAIGCGGTLARHAQAGDEVRGVFFTDGVSARGAGREEEIRRRHDAAARAAGILGLELPRHLGFPDNRLDTVPMLDLVQALEPLIDAFHPTRIYTHFGGDLNIDHRLVHQAVLTACRPLPDATVRSILCFEVPSSTGWQSPDAPSFTPHCFIDIGATLGRKLEALDTYGEELRPWPHARSRAAIEHLARWRGASAGLAAAEAFMVARQLE